MKKTLCVCVCVCVCVCKGFQLVLGTFLPMQETQVQSLGWEDSPGGGRGNPVFLPGDA